MGAVYAGVAVAIATTAAGAVWGLSVSGSVYLGALAVLAFGLGAASRPTLRQVGLRLAAAALVTLAVVSIARPLRADGRAHLVSLPDGARADAVGELVDEGDIVLPGAQAYVSSGRLDPDEARHVVDDLRSAYEDMRAEEGIVPTPWRADMRPGPALVFEPRDARRASTGIVFLHGYGGSFAMPCWQVARAADVIGAVTVCPSTGFDGAWWNRDGEARAREAIRYLRSRGVRRIYLAGLSNGSIGVSRLAPRFVHDVDGLLLLSGAASNATATSLPALVVQGRRDHMTPPAPARRYARAGGARVRYVELDGTHFLLVEQSDAVRGEIARWLIERERTHAAREPGRQGSASGIGS